MTEEISEQIIQRICECGWKAYLCGGAIRDAFLGRVPLDYDIVTDAIPEELEQIFPDRKVKTFGASFLVTSIDGIDVSTYRSDRNFGPGRFNCMTTACKTIDEDLARRDLTINALAVCPYTGEVVDPYNGLQDLNNRIIRFVGNPNQRIYEDPLRMVRAARFTALIEGNLDTVAVIAISNNKDKIKEISPERFRIELLKVLKYPKPSIFFDVLHNTGLLKILVPELNDMYNHPGGQYHDETIDVHVKLAGDHLPARDPILRLAGYLHDIGKVPTFDGEHFINHEKVGAEMVEALLSRYRFTIKEIQRVKNLVRFHMRPISGLQSDKSVRKFMKQLNDNHINFKDWFRLRMADKMGNLKGRVYSKERIKSLCLSIHNSTKLTEETGFKITDLKVNGFDIMDILNIRPGKEIGVILNNLLNLVIENPELNERKTLISLVREMKG